MTISPVNAAMQTDKTPPDTQVWRQRFGKAFDAIAAKLGMSKSDLIAELQSGKKMKDIEAEKGVSKDDIIKAAASALQAADPSLSADAATKLATSYYDGKAGHYHHHHHNKPQGASPTGNNQSAIDPTNAAALNTVDVLS
jgi:hypothetical protein